MDVSVEIFWTFVKVVSFGFILMPHSGIFWYFLNGMDV